MKLENEIYLISSFDISAKFNLLIFGNKRYNHNVQFEKELTITFPIFILVSIFYA